RGLRRPGAAARVRPGVPHRAGPGGAGRGLQPAGPGHRGAGRGRGGPAAAPPDRRAHRPPAVVTVPGGPDRGGRRRPGGGVRAAGDTRRRPGQPVRSTAGRGRSGAMSRPQATHRAPGTTRSQVWLVVRRLIGVAPGRYVLGGCLWALFWVAPLASGLVLRVPFDVLSGSRPAGLDGALGLSSG